MGCFHLVILAIPAKDPVDCDWLVVPILSLFLIPFESDDLFVFFYCVWSILVVNLIWVEMTSPKVVYRKVVISTPVLDIFCVLLALRIFLKDRFLFFFDYFFHCFITSLNH